MVSSPVLICAQRFSSSSSSCTSPPFANGKRTCLAAHGVSIAAIRSALDNSEADKLSDTSIIGREVTVRARVERVRGRGKLGFLHLRQPPLESLQAVCLGKGLTTQAKAIAPESIVDVTGLVQRAAAPVQSTTCEHGELHVTSLRVVSAAATPLPFPYRDANTKLDTRLNHRVMDLRTERMVAITRLVSALGESFRKELLARDFIEVHTPKLIAAASEGGSNVFTVDYFGKPAYLAQSPQLYKQMMLMGDAMRVFEIGPVFRAENSLTHRHLTEFVGLDGEMVIERSYTEVLDVLEPVMCAMLRDLATTHGRLMDVLSKQQQQPQKPEDDEGCVAAPSQASTERGSSAPAKHDDTTGSVSGRRDEPRRHALRDVCCEVPESIIDSLGLTNDAGATAKESDDGDALTPRSSSASSPKVDPYHARIGGASGCRVLRMAFADAVQLLADQGGADVMAGCALPLTDLSLPQERRLGELIKSRYGVDLFVVDLFPSEARPFYTMPLDTARPDGPTRSYDMYLRGEEICSGAQRIDAVLLLEQRLAAKKVDRSSVKDYIDAFRYGAWPHGGFGLGLERIALFFLGLDDIRRVSLFPRDPKRIAP
ncbi:putative mitochondrial aspartyl-tRNA synthetase [Leptomonas pyrrhocoris]|uniref:aspartate--tRNA ligase n=1 Tax=Leptomonas pyrrhocoris TaxID=157538 RepID=A0A0N0DU20_LEPPY|nr:putative mitochondrial aspartyl-tRNA synthetase [Leptomonas pyrrhocoris]KPA78248.1 putative mitochondrial aspartyl-tRNA synthetase [Leptomonas pyrrhocoris]|eukprot:XP_015656687.1 putative mitochondrial aspartyl-tRNA synthetase [Leptomonas pyrrhocoris]